MKKLILKTGVDLTAGENPPSGYKYLGYDGTDLHERSGATAIPVGAIDFDSGVEKLTGELFDGKDVYTKTLSGSTFPVAFSYGSVAHGLNMATAKIIESFGYVDYNANSTAAMYANYFDATNYYWYWTDSANLPYRLVLKYTKD
jgi:hypothetical protein